MITSIDELIQIAPHVIKTNCPKIIVVNKSDLLSNEEIRKLSEKIKSKKLNALLISCLINKGIPELKKRITDSMNVLRIYMKEPGKPLSPIPMVLPLNSTVKDVAEHILKGFSQRVKETHITGPSSKFPNQKVGLSHILKDQDIIEFHTN